MPAFSGENSSQSAPDIQKFARRFQSGCGQRLELRSRASGGLLQAKSVKAATVAHIFSTMKSTTV